MRDLTALNLIFGVLGVASFGYAVWINRRAASTKRLTERLTGDVRQLATNIYVTGVGGPVEGYARSIVEICGSLLADVVAAPAIGRVVLKYPAFLMPPMQTDIGKVVVDHTTPYDRAVCGRKTSESRKGLVYGPLEPLPVTGSYEATFSTRVALDIDCRIDDEATVMILDVYDNRSANPQTHVLSERVVTKGQMTEDYFIYVLPFQYRDLSQSLEYRISVISESVTVCCDRIEISRVSS